MTVSVPVGLDYANISFNEQNVCEIEDVVVPELVWSYLVHNGYEKAAAAFQKSWASQKTVDKPSCSTNFQSIGSRKSKFQLFFGLVTF